METLLRDIRFALRGLRRSPGFALAAVLTIGLAIGVNTVVFAWAERFVLRPLPAVPDADRLVALQEVTPGGGFSEISYATYRAWREGARAFEGVAAQAPVQLSLGHAGSVQRVWGVFSSWNLLQTLHVNPILGRSLLPEDEAHAIPAAVISHALWQRAFAGDSGVVGRRVMLNRRDFTIVGVLPRRFSGTEIGLSYDMWVPLTLRETLRPEQGVVDNPGWHWLSGVGRLRPGVTIEQARRDLGGVHRSLVEAWQAAPNSGVGVRPIGRLGAGAAFRPIAAVLVGVTALVLLVACANLANLLLARAVARRREVGIRLALGAGRMRLARQLLTESTVLALGGGLLGTLTALWAKDVLRAFIPPTPLPIGFDLTLDWTVLGATALATIATGLLFGLAPALQASRTDVVQAVRGGTSAAAARGSRLRSAFVCTQVALSLVSLVCAGLFLRGLQRVGSVDVGLREPESVLLVSTNLFRAGLGDSAGPAVVDRLLSEVSAVPGVRSASVANWVPLGPGGHHANFVTIAGSVAATDLARVANNSVGPDYFQTMGIGLVRGRGIAAQDRPGRPAVAVVSEALVRRHWPDRDPLGQRISFPDRQWRTVVGVARDVRLALDEAPAPIVYLAFAQDYYPDIVIHVSVSGDRSAVTRSLRRAFERTHPDLPFLDVRTMAQEMGFATLLQRVAAWMLAGFGALALALSTMGLYGVMAYSVSQRTREIGVRVALGAQGGDIVGLVVGGGLRVVAVGLGAGLVFAAGAGRLIRSQILGVSPLDPVTFVAAGVLMAMVAVLAAWLPARRAAKVDPIVALQAE